MTLNMIPPPGTPANVQNASTSSLATSGTGGEALGAVTQNSPNSPQETQSTQRSVSSAQQTSNARSTDPSDGTNPHAQNLTEAVGQLQEFVQSMKRNLEFSVDADSGQFVIKVIDAETDQLIRQIPPEEVLRFARSLGKQQGALIRTEA